MPREARFISRASDQFGQEYVYCGHALTTEPMRTVTARAPTRIDFGGGWTDVPPYCDREGGFVCNIAITRYARAIVERWFEDHDAVLNTGMLVDAALKRTGLSNDVLVTLH